MAAATAGGFSAGAATVEVIFFIGVKRKLKTFFLHFFLLRQRPLAASRGLEGASRAKSPPFLLSPSFSPSRQEWRTLSDRDRSPLRGT